MLKIIFERSGGFVGRKISLTLDLDELPADQSGLLRGLLDEANFSALPENPPVNPVPDGFQYTITVETETATHTVRVGDLTAPEKLQPLLQDLSRRARAQLINQQAVRKQKRSRR